MALKVWLPFNGNLKNQGLGTDGVGKGTIAYSAGKIGQCIDFSANANVASGSENMVVIPGLQLPTFTFCAWVKVTSAAIQDDQIVAREGKGYNANGWDITINKNTNKIAASASWISYTFPDTGEVNKWYHIAFTHANQVNYWYFNGELVYSANCGDVAYDTTTTSDGNAITFGARGRDGAYHLPFQGCINDFRLYNEALSQKQIKEISKGLVAHYKLEGTGANPNLAKNTNTANLSTNVCYQHFQTGGSTRELEYDEYGIPCIKITRDDVEQSGWQYLSYDNFDRAAIKTSTTYTVSMDVKASVSGTISLTGLLNGNATNYMTNSSTTINGTVNANEWNHLVFTCTTIADFSSIATTAQVIYWSTSAALRGTRVVLWIKNVKLEEGNKNTSWIPNVADAAYTALEYNNMIARDISGNGYSGTISGSLNYNSDSARYSGCTKFSDNSFIKINQLLNWEAKQVSFSFWFNMTGDTQNKYSAIFIPNGSPTAANGLWLSINTESVGLWAYRSSFKPNYHKAGALIETTGWHHAVFVWDTGVSKWYLDGSQYGSTVDTWATETLSSTLDYTIGDSYTGTSWNGTPFTGRLSDFRIYATALTADDILTLYKTSGIIDNKGNVYAYEFKEV